MLNHTNHTVINQKPIKRTFNKILHDDIFPNNLIDNETSFAKIPTISRNPIKRLIPISAILENTHCH
jgi:hypothetical protein